MTFSQCYRILCDFIFIKILHEASFIYSDENYETVNIMVIHFWCALRKN